MNLIDKLLILYKRKLNRHSNRNDTFQQSVDILRNKLMLCLSITPIFTLGRCKLGVTFARGRFCDGYSDTTFSELFIEKSSSSTKRINVIIIIIIVVITLFQEGNIFGTSASLTYGSQLQLEIVSFVIDKWLLFTVWTEKIPSMLRAGSPTLPTWRRKYDLSRLKTSRLPHVVRDSYWVFTHSLDAN